MSFFTNRRRGRGYAFETSIVKFFDKTSAREDDWHARRLGGSSVGLPDVVVTNNKKSILFTIEAKSTFQGVAYIPNDQILRCQEVCDVFGAYKKRYIVFAFKFSKNPEKGRDKLRYHFFKVIKPKHLKYIEWVKCFYDGRIRYKIFSGFTYTPIDITLKLMKFDSLISLRENMPVVTLGDLQNEI